MQQEGGNAVVGIDERLIKKAPPEYYHVKFNRTLDETNRKPGRG